MAISMKRASEFCGGIDHCEGVAVHPDGSVWAGGEAGQIYRVSPDGSQVEEVARADGGFILGLAFGPGAEWLAACDLMQRCVWRLDLPSGKLSRFADGVDGHHFGIPNHLVFDRDGTLYVTDSGAFRQVCGKILRFDADHSGRGCVWHDGPFNFANGITIGPKDGAVYMCCTWLPGVERIALQPDGTAGRRSRFVRLPKSLPDGLAFDARGNLYVSAYTPSRIYRVTPDGKASIVIEDWEEHMLCHPTNIAFGGPDFKDLFTSNLGRWHITRIDLRVRGARLASHQT
jgi:sugar lactone lactonase YvrE